MDKLLQKENEMQDEELYALLDKAMETERLCVSEDLIQKTLKRVAEQEDSKVISFEKATKRKLPAMKYVSVAAAAVFVAVLGVGVLRGGSVSKDGVQMEATYDKTSRGTEALLSDSAYGSNASVAESKNDGAAYYYSTSDTDDIGEYAVEGEAVANERPGVKKSTDEDEGLLEGTVTAVSAELSDALDAAGMTPVSREAEYWEFVQPEVSWEEALFEALAAKDTLNDPLAENGAYRYRLVCRDGSRENVGCDYPLDGIVRIETKKGTLWGFLGEYVRFYAE